MDAVKTQRPFSPPLSPNLLEPGLLALIAPFLLFPTVWPMATAVALLLLLYFLRPLKPSPLNVVWLVWWVTVLVASLVTADPDQTLPKLTGLLLGYAGWAYLATMRHSSRWLGGAFLVWALLGVGFIFIGLLSTAWLDKIPILANLLQRLPNQVIRLPGNDAGVQPNQLAGTLLLYLPFLGSLLLGWRPHTHLRLALTAVGLILIMAATLLILTQSRSGWVGALGGFLALLLLWGIILPPSRQRRILLAGAALLIASGLAGMIWIGPENLQRVWDDPAQSSQTAVGSLQTIGFRQEVWRWSLVAISDFPFTGVGLGAFRDVVRRFYPLNVAITYDIAHAHNIFLQVTLDIGIPGLISYLAFLILAAILAWRVAQTNATYRPFALGLLASFIALHIYGLTDALALGSKTGLSFWFALGLLTAMHRLANTPHSGDKSPALC